MLGINPTWPEAYNVPFVKTACEYGPIAAGAFVVVIICFVIFISPTNLISSVYAQKSIAELKKDLPEKVDPKTVI